jgi:hypothetical protein
MATEGGFGEEGAVTRSNPRKKPPRPEFPVWVVLNFQLGGVYLFIKTSTCMAKAKAEQISKTRGNIMF